MLFKTNVIHETGLAPLARHFDYLIGRMMEVERLGWRYLWEGDFVEGCLVAAGEAAAAVQLVAMADAAGIGATLAVKVELLNDLSTYQRFFEDVVHALVAWPSRPSSGPDVVFN